MFVIDERDRDFADASVEMAEFLEREQHLAHERADLDAAEPRDAPLDFNGRHER